MKIETKDLILKTDISSEDIEKIHQNVFSQNETAKYMLWRASNEIEWTKKRLKSWQESNIDLNFIYEKANNIPIGFLTFSQEGDTINMYNKLAENISKYFKNMRLKLKDLKSYHIEGFYKSEYARGLSSNSVLKYHVLIRECLQYAFINDLVLVNVADKVKRPKSKNLKQVFMLLKRLKNCLRLYKITNVNFLLCLLLCMVLGGVKCLV